MANLKTAVRKELVNGVAAQSSVIAAQETLNKKRDGMYTCGIKAAIVAKDVKVFTEVIETLEQDFRFNRRGIAEKYDVPQAKTSGKNAKPKVDEDGNPIFIVPSSLRTMKTWVLKGFKFQVDFGTKTSPTPFSVVRTAVQAAEDELKKADRTPDEEARDVIREVLAVASKNLDKVSGKRALTASLKLVQALNEALEKQAA